MVNTILEVDCIARVDTPNPANLAENELYMNWFIVNKPFGYDHICPEHGMAEVIGARTLLVIKQSRYSAARQELLSAVNALLPVELQYI